MLTDEHLNYEEQAGATKRGQKGVGKRFLVDELIAFKEVWVVLPGLTLQSSKENWVVLKEGQVQRAEHAAAAMSIGRN